MPRPTKQTVDYFPHYVTDSKTKYMLEKNWGNDGYAFWFKLLELLCRTDGHSYSLKDPLDWEYFIAFMGVDDSVAKAIIKKLSDIGKIDTKLWRCHKIIWCQNLIDNLKPVYAKRTIEVPEKPKFNSKKGVSDPKTGVSGVDNPQSRVDEIKLDDTPPIYPPKGGETTPTTEKRQFGIEFNLVRLTDDEYGKLAERLGKSSAADYIERLDNYLAEGHRKKNHYATILNWWRKDNPKHTVQRSWGKAGDRSLGHESSLDLETFERLAKEGKTIL